VIRTPDTTASASLQSDLAVASYSSPAEIESAILELQHSGFDILKLTNIDRHSGRSRDRWGHQCTGLYSMKFPGEYYHRYETALQIDKSILIAQWTTEEVASGGEEINRTHPESVDEY